MMIEALKIFCACCGRIFGVCRDCYRGHKYCSDACRIAGYHQSRLKAQNNYRQTGKGKKQHSESEKRRRKRKKTELKRIRVIGAIKKACMCFSMTIKSLFKNYDPERGKGNCLICGKGFLISSNSIEVIEPWPLF
jgi:hypothetical protein